MKGFELVNPQQDKYAAHRNDDPADDAVAGPQWQLWGRPRKQVDQHQAEEGAAYQGERGSNNLELFRFSGLAEIRLQLYPKQFHLLLEEFTSIRGYAIH